MKIEYSPDEIKSKILGYINDDTILKKVLKVSLNVLGKVRAILEAVQRGLSEFVFNILLQVYNNQFIDSSDDEALAQHLADRGLEPWKQAMKSTGSVRIGSTTIPSANTPIPQLAIVGTEGDSSEEIKQFVLLTGGSIGPSTPADSKGYFTVEIAVESLYAGADYNVPIDSISQLISEIPGINVVYNPAATSYGRDTETREEVQTRLKTYNLATQQGSRGWFASKTLEFSFVSDVVVVPRYSGKGTVGIAFLTPSGLPTTEQKQTVADYFNSEDIDPAGAYNVIIFDMSEHEWTATIKVYWQGSAPLDSALNAALQNYFNMLTRGEDIIEDQVKAAIIFYTGGIKKVEIISHSGYAVNVYEYPILGTMTWQKEEYAE